LHWIAARLADLDADSPALIEYIKKNRMAPAPTPDELTKIPANDTSQLGQTSALLEIFQNKVFGHF